MEPNQTLETQNPTVPTVQSPLVKPLEGADNNQMANTTNGGKSKSKVLMAGLPILIIVAGVVSGYFLSGNVASSNSSNGDSPATALGGVSNSRGNSVTEEGIRDDELFPDKAEGELQVNDGSVTQEGSHVLIRPGGADQTAYLTSSVVDLDKFVGKQIEIYGQTHTAQTAGWLMDVGYARVID